MVKGSAIRRVQGPRFWGYRANAGRSKKFRVRDSFGAEVVLQSTYEKLCAELLDELGIRWIRPSHLKYAGNKKYFPDFFLPDLNIYLDPKNPFKERQDRAKIESVKKMNDVKLFVLSIDQLKKEELAHLAQW